MSSNNVSKTRPRVLLLYYSHTQQSQRVSEAMAETLRGRGCDVSQAAIGFTDLGPGPQADIDAGRVRIHVHQVRSGPNDKTGATV
jgi:hypothetical protein